MNESKGDKGMGGIVPSRVGGGAPELDFAERKSWDNYLNAVLRVTMMLNRQLDDSHQLSLIDVQLLAHLDSSPAGGVQMGVLAGALASTPSRLTRQIRRLEDQGLVERTVSPSDRRRVLATITSFGRTSVERAMITYAASVRSHFFGVLTRPQIASMAESCGQINRALRICQDEAPAGARGGRRDGREADRKAGVRAVR
ncbi:MarR family winged helix-turn-helix transcriptional regulator [Mycobacterium sp. SMC-15]|uniref:MarR family winged helix-turn-helix transcriptional regulator n=1 Tax=Mycobacterium sp. SMC-15 TaxID=3381627 RepID=UPI0038766A13